MLYCKKNNYSAKENFVDNIFVSDLSSSKHIFSNYHFCRGNSNKRKTRLGVISKGSGTYIYLNKRLEVKEGDVVFIPENIYCYSEWHGEPDIEVVYVSGFIHYGGFMYEPQIVDKNVADDILRVSELISMGKIEALEAYSVFYRILMKIIPQMKESNIAYDKTLQNAIEFITKNWNQSFSVADVSKHCCVSESTLYHMFQKELGQTPVSFLNSIKINVAIEYLENTDYSVSTISSMVGFNSENHFRRVFAELTGYTPLKYKKNK